MVITVSLPPFLGRSEAATFRNQLLVALEQKESVAVECAEAGPLPSLWVQLLHSAATSAKARGLSVTLKAASSSAANLCGRSASMPLTALSFWSDGHENPGHRRHQDPA